MTRELPHGAKLATIWLLIGVVVFLGMQWWLARAEASRFSANAETIEIRRSPDGHYHWPGRINGRAVDFLIDTGATGTALPASLASELKLESLGAVQSDTAGGTVTGQIVRVDIELRGGVNVERLRVIALPRLSDSPLLGMDVLGKLHWQQRDGVLRIDPPRAVDPARDSRAETSR